MKGKVQRKSKGKRDTEKLKKFMISIDEFVQNKTGGSGADEFRTLSYVKKKSRKEVRREKRKLKKAKMKRLPKDEGNINKNQQKNVTPVENKTETKVQKRVRFQTENEVGFAGPGASRKTKAKKMESQQGKKKNRLQETRKKALLEANEAEDREIKKLERCLGLNKRKNKKNLPMSFVADGLDYILEALDAGSAGSGLYESDEEMEISKEKFDKLADSENKLMNEDDDDGDDDDDDGDDDDDDGYDDDDGDDDQESEKHMEEDFCAEDSEDGEMEEFPSEEGTVEADAQEELPVNAPGKYLPPQLRELEDGKRRAELERLRKTVKGLVNRLSEPNMASISGQMEAMYMSHSRKDMNDTLTAVMLAACVSPALMPERLLMEHILLVSILHHNVGLEVGAHFLEAVVQRFDEAYRAASGGKECDNLLGMVAHLYSFQVVHALLVFDLLRKLVGVFAEKDMELILLTLRSVGFGLRKDDAVSLRELICESQRKASALGEKFREQARVRFMLETMLALKNNDMRKIPGYNPEPVERLRKLQRTLVQRNASGSDVKLRVSLENLLAAEQVGRWWIVGSSWSGAPMIGEHEKTQPAAVPEGQFSAKVLELARKQRMNTDVRKSIFCIVMTSEDYLDAFEKLLRLGLKDQQEREIIRVLLDCCLQERLFNAFYIVLADKFCAHDRRFQMTLQFTLWDKFKELQNMSSTVFSNLVQLVIHVLQKKTLSISILKVIEFGELDKTRVRFLRQVLSKLLRDTDHQVLGEIFGRISGLPKLKAMREGLKLFISHFLLRNTPSDGDGEGTRRLKEGAQVATKAMEAKEDRLKL
ncbi:nucleolar MIF4G domain-containing protein 1 isoform X2 [Brienomyrus brachyistius]|nr:nucleolar MIF4G domain-containing protein 1 isoform X2 [Brienomyrus brachyistius]XP_048866599.1 nucleolar MIF4G domain-containing protein 1 isoform X2 [Brienomyrus brachyistius]XP_048866600.1 nucleolar MIF4G domain-containing protein 1 isoform X2 [Brienomyrus brachyistius]XP_048866601.1 nucleolar MIF4G domain-containing protein 1 isoform X2 [Brienomyrus brachyistius]XP_048866602.1 nucleolar MIF4G domain-containing protein 1 isoform X2 [Brienomyrus brachyistius]